MTSKATTAHEPAWSWIIGGGLALILVGGAMLQMQFGGPRTSAEFTTVSRYESAPVSQSAAAWPQPPLLESAPSVAESSEFSPRLGAFTPPPNQPDWLVAPCSAVRAAQLQEAWADHLGLPCEVSNRLGQVFRLIPPGIYDRGAQLEAMQALLDLTPAEDQHWRECLLSSVPAHRVVVSKAFYLAVNETTQSEYAAVMGRNPAWYSTSGPEPYYVELVQGEDTDRHPVEGVTWNEAQGFARKLATSHWGELVGFPSAQPADSKTVSVCVASGEIDCGLVGEAGSSGSSPLRYRLPTDAEWEHACRGGSASPYFFGETEPAVRGWFGEPNGGRTWPIGSGEANPLGLFGVHSSVWEWVEDHWSRPEYGSYFEWPVRDPLNTSGTPLPRVVRGGMWPDRRSRSFDRYAYDQDFQTFFVGFRLALELPAGGN